MTSTCERRVRTVRLHAPDESLIRRGAVLLEDALRTASLPDVGAGRLLVIRSFSVGTIRSQQSAASLALNIEKRLHQLRSCAVYAMSPGARHYTAVYFRDEVEPYVLLALKLSRRECPDEWFWRPAVPDWRSGMPRDEALRTLLFGVMRTQAGTWAAVRMLTNLQTEHIIDPMLSSLRWLDGERLLQEFGWSRSPASLREMPIHAERQSVQLPRGWEDILVQWIERWNYDDDPRPAWLACAALVAEKPGRLLDRRLLHRGKALLRAVRFQGHMSQLDTRSSVEGSKRETSSSNDEITTSDEASKQIGLEEEVPAKGKGTTSDIRDMLQVPEENGESYAPRESTSVRSSPESGATTRESGDADLFSRMDDTVDTWPVTPQPTAYAGMFFLVAVLSKLGIENFLEVFPHWIEHDLAARLFFTFCERLNVPEQDAIRVALPGIGNESGCQVFDFFVPGCWMTGIAEEGAVILRGVRDFPGLRIIADASQRLTLGLWRGKFPAGVRLMIGIRGFKKGAWLAYESELEMATQAWITAARRWCRRFAHIGLRDLICRPGRISVTRTHVDVLLDHRQSETRVRKAGLDFNPGWVPWLGRVVRFHYLYGEQIDAN